MTRGKSKADRIDEEHQRFGDYELTQYLAAGGMADLYLAKSPRHDHEVVVKKIQPRYVEMTRVVKMFIDEGRIAKALDHPNIVKVLDVGQERGTYYIVMEYIPGPDLLAICRRGIEVGNFLPLPITLAIIAQALKGLTYAHEKKDEDGKPLKVVHCDISPGNIVVSWGGTARIVDFGIARATIQLRAEDHTVVGKYNYMAPEQVRGQVVDARADLFALGIILYELVVGKRLFRGSPEEVMKMVLQKDITPPSEIRENFPTKLNAVVMRALSRDPNMRYQTARGFRRDIMACLTELGEPAGKREISKYLRTVFAAPRKGAAATEFLPEVAQTMESEGSPEVDEDLELERTPLSLLTESQRLRVIEAKEEVDPEDDAEPASSPEPVAPMTKDTAVANTPAKSSVVQTAEVPALRSRAPQKTPLDTFGAETALAVGAVILAIAIYFFLGR